MTVPTVIFETSRKSVVALSTALTIQTIEASHMATAKDSTPRKRRAPTTAPEEKYCPQCFTTKKAEEFHPCRRDGLQSQCKLCQVAYNVKRQGSTKEYNTAYHKRPRSRIRRRTKEMLQRYRLTLQQWDVMFGKQEGMCAICTTLLDRGKRTHVDHCHATGRIRSLLCGHCNHGLGKFCDSPALIRKAADYIEFHKAVEGLAA